MRGLVQLAVVLLLALLAPTAPAAAAAGTPAQRLCQDYLSGALTVEVLGDSIMYGSGATSQERGWPYLAWQAWARGGGRLWVGAVPGSVASDYLPGGIYYAHTEFTRAVRPTVVILDWRINEQYLWEWNRPRAASPAQLTVNIIALVEHIRQTSPDTTVLIANPPHPLVSDWARAIERQYIEALWSAKVATGALWLDLAQYFPQPGEPNPIGLMSPDQLHPGDPGQAVIAAAMHQRVHATCT